MSEPMLKIGDTMPDGTVYAGISPDIGKAIYTTPADAPLTITFNKAKKYAVGLDAHGRRDWRVPTKGELNVLFENRAAIGGFNETGLRPGGWYWSSSQRVGAAGLILAPMGAWEQRFSDGDQQYFYMRHNSALRCVRG